MLIVLGKRSLSRICYQNGIKFAKNAIAFRFKGTSTKEEISIVDEQSKATIPAPVPGMISAAVLRQFSNLLRIENVNQPKLVRPNEVLIDVSYCALNGSDVLLMDNSYTYEPDVPTILGYELVGKLVEVGEEAKQAGYKTGDKVIALNKERRSGLAEQCVVEFGDIWKIPSTVKMLDAVSLLDNYATALIGLEKRAEIQEDDMVLINVGLGGVGLAAVDIATNIFRAKVIGVCATEDRANLVREKGAFASLKFNDKKLMKHIEAIAAERDIKDIFDGVGGENFKKVLHCFTDVYKPELIAKNLLRDDDFAVVVQYISREGRVILAGITATKIEKPSAELQKGSFSVTGVNLLEYRRKNHDLYRQAGEEILEYYQDGLISPSHSLIAGLHQINEAVKFVSEMKSSGKVIIDLKNKEVIFDSVEEYEKHLLNEYGKSS